MKKPAGGHKKPKGHVPHKTGGGAKRKGVRASGAPVPAPAKHPQHHAHHPPGHRMTNPLVPAPHHHKHKKPKQPVKRKLSLGEGVACCVAEALAASLRLAGGAVSDEDVLALYWRTAADADAGATISATLEAAERFGLAGVRPAFDLVGDLGERCCDVACLGCREVMGALLQSEQLNDGTVDAVPAPQLADGGRVDRRLVAAQQFRDPLIDHPASVILGVTLPGGPHAILAEGDTCWSWGEPWPATAFSDAVIEEAWAVQWAA